jgi:hypothetical protein
MIGNEIDEALEALIELEKSLVQVQPRSDQEELALEKARSQAAQLTEQLRKLRDGHLPAAAEPTN